MQDETMQEAEPDDLDAIDEMSQLTGVDRETIITILETQRDLEATCAICGAEHDAETPVDWYQLPFQGPRRLCWRCAAQAFHDVSLLSENEAKVLALRLAGKTNREADDLLDIDEAATYMSRVRDKAESAPIEIDRNKATQHLYDQLESQ